MSIPLLDGAVAVVYLLVADLARTLSPIGGAATAIVLCTAALRCRPLDRGAYPPVPLPSVSGARTRTNLDEATGAVQ